MLLIVLLATGLRLRRPRWKLASQFTIACKPWLPAKRLLSSHDLLDSLVIKRNPRQILLSATIVAKQATSSVTVWNLNDLVSTT
jgi:hypothetical protein